jgi:tetratricopeptide (TPR) repeat protein
VRPLVALLVTCVSLPALAGKAEHAYRLINEWRIAEAEAEIAPLLKSQPHAPEVAFIDGQLKFMHGDYAGAVARFDEAAEKERAGELGTEIREMRDLARATAEATRGYQSVRGKHFVVSFAPGKDALLAPYALDALEKAYAALGRDFDDRAEEPVRVEIYPEVADLAKVSTLTLKEIETSGTIALCKFNRLMITSPRALLHGYPWLDTLTHEYTHFVISRVSHNTVPIWLHEGLAKFEERRWRLDHDKNGGLTPTMEHLLATGVQRKHLITFEQMHPSMAKLPSQEDTALAFAEVYMVVQYLEETVGWDGIRKIIAGLRDGKNDAQAVAQVVGVPFDQFQTKWRTWLHGKKLRVRPGLIPTELEFKKSPKDTEASKDDSAKIGEERARKLARLGGMLRVRHRLRAAATEYEKAQAIVGPGNIQVANKLARTYLELGDVDRAIKTAEPAIDLYPDQAGPNATLGEAWLKKKDTARAQPYLEAALAVSPFDPQVHCGLVEVYRQKTTQMTTQKTTMTSDPRLARESDACRTLGGE